jgi:hypothetical protein
MTNSEILNLLVSNVENHCEAKAREFHNGLEVNKPTYDYVWGKTDQGYIIYSSHSSVFLDPVTGMAHKISQWWDSLDIKKHQLLHKLCNNCRVEIPISCNIVRVKNENWEHKIVQRPNKELGLEYASYILSAGNDSQYFNEYITEATTILRHMNTVVSELGDGLPEVQMRPTKLLRDSVGYFWIDFKRWNVPQHIYIKKNLECFSSTLRVWNHNFPNRINVPTLLGRAANEWAAIQGF